MADVFDAFARTHWQQRVPSTLFLCGWIDNIIIRRRRRIDVASKAEPPSAKGSKSSSRGIEGVLTSIENFIDQGEHGKALEKMKSAESEITLDPRAHKLAGDARLGIAQSIEDDKPKLRTELRKAREHYRFALKIDPKAEGAERGLNRTLSLFDRHGIRASRVPRLISDQTPTVWGLILVPALFIGFLWFLANVDSLGSWLSFSGTAEEADDRTRATMTLSYQPDSGSRTTVVVVIDLDPVASPNHVDNFVKLADSGQYNGTIFHRIIDDFMIQGGDFTNRDGTGGHAAEWYGYCDGNAVQEDECTLDRYTIPDEADNGLLHNPCTISMAKTNAAHTGGSQFFLIPEDSTPTHLDGKHTVFGTITSGCDDVTAISSVSTDANDRPGAEVRLESVVIS